MSDLTRRELIGRGALAGAVVMGAGPILSACGGSDSDNSEPQRGGNLRVGLTGGGATESLDPFHQLLSPDILRAYLLYSYVGETNAEYDLQGLMAESVEPANPTGTEWDVRLRDGMEFHNGKTVTADDLIWSFQNLLDPKVQASGALFIPWAQPNRIKKLDDRTARFTLSQPVSIFEEAIYNFQTTIVPAGFDPNKPIGAGPFMYESFEPGDRSIFRRFENFYGQVPHVDSLEVITFKDDTALQNALVAGDIEVAGSVGAKSVAALEGAGATIVRTPGMNFHPLTMRMDSEPFKDERVREAFRLIPDREQFVEQVYSGYGEVANDLYAWDDPAYAADLPQREQDLERARALLAEAGHENLTVELPTTAYTPGQVETAQVFAEQAKGAGVNVDVRVTDADTFFTQYYLEAPFSSDTFTNNPYMNNTRQAQLPDSPYNQAHWDDPEFTKLYNEALATPDADRRTEILRDMQQIQYDRGTFLIPAKADGIDAMAANVGGLESDQRWAYPLNGYHLENVYIG